MVGQERRLAWNQFNELPRRRRPIAALLEAAGQLDREARADRARRRLTARRPLLATYIFAGLRTGEALDLRWGDVHLAAGRIRVEKAKTDAGERDVRLLPALRDELAALKARTQDTAADALVFGTATGRRQGPSNVRRRVLAPTVERADEHLGENDDPPSRPGSSCDRSAGRSPRCSMRWGSRLRR